MVNNNYNQVQYSNNNMLNQWCVRVQDFKEISTIKQFVIEALYEKTSKSLLMVNEMWILLEEEKGVNKNNRNENNECCLLR